MSDKPTIELPTSGPITQTPFEKEAKDKFRGIDNLIYAIVAAVVITAISALIAVSAIVLDQLHFNNETYRDYKQFIELNTKTALEIEKLKIEIEALKTRKK